MSKNGPKYLMTSDWYHHVEVYYKDRKKFPAFYYLPKVGKRKFKRSEREAALAVDKELIKRGKKPVNILKPLNG
jgi:hypothetical protein